MSRLACFICGRTIWATLPAVQLSAAERRCPRCGGSLEDDRRATDRRTYIRRQDEEKMPPTGKERRVGDRRTDQRRRPI